MSTAIIAKGSIAAKMALTAQSFQDILMDLTAVVMVDTSGSMGARDVSAEGTISRFGQAISHLQVLQEENPGKFLIFSFDNEVRMHLGGVPDDPDRSYDLRMTRMDLAVKALFDFDGTGVRLFLLTDGEPSASGMTSDEHQSITLKMAAKFETPIDVIHMGAQSDVLGITFCRKLAQASGGRFQKTTRPGDLMAPIKAALALPAPKRGA